MNWDNLKFTGRDVLMIIVYVVTGTSFVLLMKGDIRSITDGMDRIEGNQKEQKQDQEAFRAKSEAEWSEIKVRLGILEKRVDDLELKKQKW